MTEITVSAGRIDNSVSVRVLAGCKEVSVRIIVDACRVEYSVCVA